MANESGRIHQEWRSDGSPTGALGVGVGRGGERTRFNQEFTPMENLGGGHLQRARGTRGAHGSQSHGSRATHGSGGRQGAIGSHAAENIGSQGTRSGPASSGSSSGVQAPAMEIVPPPKPLPRVLWTSAPSDQCPPSTEERRGSKRAGGSQGTESGSTASGSEVRKHKHRKKVAACDQHSTEARLCCRKIILEWFASHDMPYLESTFLNDGPAGLEKASNALRLLLQEGMAGDEFQEDRGKSNWGQWIEEQVQEALFNSTVPFNMLCGPGSGCSGGNSELLQKLENWKRGAILAKGKGRTTLPKFVGRALADDIASRDRNGLKWLPKGSYAIPVDENSFQGSFGIVRRVRIAEACFIPEWLHFAGKTMKVTDFKTSRDQRSIEAMSCPVDHPGVIKLQYLNRKTLESYSLWWNGGSLKNMRAFDLKFGETHEMELLKDAGLDFEARKKLVVYRKNRAHLAWALMCIVDVVHGEEVLHCDLHPNNVMLHFPTDRDGAIFIGICDWGMASFMPESAPSYYGVQSEDAMKKHMEMYSCAAPELFHVHGSRGSSQSPRRMAKLHPHTYKSESYSVGVLARQIYNSDSTSVLFQQNRDPNGVKMRFEQGLDEMTEINPAARQTVTHVVRTLKLPPYNLQTPSMCFRDTHS
jgi:hypothetical protein